MRRYTLLYIIYSLLFIIVGCKPKAEVPSQFIEANAEADIYPDYKDVVVPPNIAALNFIVHDSTATAYVAQLKGKEQELLAGASEDGVIRMDTTEWRALLTARSLR